MLNKELKQIDLEQIDISMNTKEQDDDFRIKFSDRFFEIARMADKSDDEGYGKGLVKLLIDIDDFIRETREQAYKEGYEEGYEEGYDKGWDDGRY